MNEMMAKLLAKQKDSKMSPMEKESKMAALQNLKTDMNDILKGNLEGGMKKVTVASNDEEGLEHGLDKAKELLEKKEHGKDYMDHEAKEEELESKFGDDMSEEELDKMIQMLMKKKQSISSTFEE